MSGEDDINMASGLALTARWRIPRIRGRVLFMVVEVVVVVASVVAKNSASESESDRMSTEETL